MNSKYFKCYNCEITFEEDDLVEVDYGGWEEFWGAKVWHHQYVDCCPKCHQDDIEEIEYDEEE